MYARSHADVTHDDTAALSQKVEAHSRPSNRWTLSSWPPASLRRLPRVGGRLCVVLSHRRGRGGLTFLLRTFVGPKPSRAGSDVGWESAVSVHRYHSSSVPLSISSRQTCSTERGARSLDTAHFFVGHATESVTDNLCRF